VGIAIGVPTRAERKQLTPREREILQLVAQGLTNLQIAKMLFISQPTVKLHVHHILEKLGARTRTEAARFANEA
jgi:DNA-binding NarL/FixJ family response regulator